MFRCVRSITTLVVSSFLLIALQGQAYAQSREAFDRPTGQFSIDLDSVLGPAASDRPVSMVQPPNDSSKWFVIDQEGFVSLFSDGDTFTKVGTMIDLRDRVTRSFDGRKWNEMGLLSISVHPDFASNGYVYLYYSTAGPVRPRRCALDYQGLPV